MKVLQFMLSLLIIIDFIEISLADNDVDFSVNKRPFCNAFTGCGRKRDPSYSSGGLQQLPIPIYRALLRLADNNARLNTAAEVRMRQRFSNPLDFQEQLPPPRVEIY